MDDLTLIPIIAPKSVKPSYQEPVMYEFSNKSKELQSKLKAFMDDSTIDLFIIPSENLADIEELPENASFVSIREFHALIKKDKSNCFFSLKFSISINRKSSPPQTCPLNFGFLLTPAIPLGLYSNLVLLSSGCP